MQPIIAATWLAGPGGTSIATSVLQELVRMNERKTCFNNPAPAGD